METAALKEPSIGAMDMKEYLTAGRRRLWRELIMEISTTPQPVPKYIIQVASSAAPAPGTTNKKVMTAKRWDLQQIYL